MRAQPACGKAKQKGGRKVQLLRGRGVGAGRSGEKEMEYEKKPKSKWGNGKVEVRNRRKSFVCDRQRLQQWLQCSRGSWDINIITSRQRPADLLLWRNTAVFVFWPHPAEENRTMEELNSCCWWWMKDRGRCFLLVLSSPLLNRSHVVLLLFLLPSAHSFFECLTTFMRSVSSRTKQDNWSQGGCLLYPSPPPSPVPPNFPLLLLYSLSPFQENSVIKTGAPTDPSFVLTFSSDFFFFFF